jgi:hypothetical protein
VVVWTRLLVTWPPRGGAPDGLAQVAVDAPNDALALARALLPTVPHPAIEYHLPVLQVERYIFDALALLFFTSTADTSKLGLICL